MPGFTTHYLIGQESVFNLPECSLRKILRKHPDIYHLGVQGPDLFFYNAALFRHRGRKNIGIWMHEFHISEFIECMLLYAGKAEDRDQQEMAISYAAGYMSHCIADSIIHPYVYARIGYDPKSKKARRGSTSLHCQLENDIDAILLEVFRQQKPSEFDQASTFSLTREERRFLAAFLCDTINETYYPERYGNSFSITSGVVARSIVAMRLGVKVFSDPEEKKKRKIGFFESMLHIKPVASSKLVTDNVTDVAWSLNTGHELWTNPWDKSLISDESFEELLEQVEKKTHECFMLLNDYVSEKEEPRLNALLDSFGNYSLHSGLHAGVI